MPGIVRHEWVSVVDWSEKENNFQLLPSHMKIREVTLFYWKHMPMPTIKKKNEISIVNVRARCDITKFVELNLIPIKYQTPYTYSISIAPSQIE